MRKLSTTPATTRAVATNADAVRIACAWHAARGQVSLREITPPGRCESFTSKYISASFGGTITVPSSVNAALAGTKEAPEVAAARRLRERLPDGCTAHAVAGMVMVCHGDICLTYVPDDAEKLFQAGHENGQGGSR